MEEQRTVVPEGVFDPPQPTPVEESTPTADDLHDTPPPEVDEDVISSIAAELDVDLSESSLKLEFTSTIKVIMDYNMRWLRVIFDEIPSIIKAIADLRRSAIRSIMRIIFIITRSSIKLIKNKNN